MFFKNMKTGMKLGLGVAIILLAVITSSFITYLLLNTVHEDIDLVINESLPGERITNDMAFQTLKVLNLLLYSSVTENQKGFKSSEIIVNEFKKNIAKLKNMQVNKDINKILDDIIDLETAFDKYYEYGKEMAFVYLTEGIKQGNELVGAFEKASEELTDKMKNLQNNEILRTGLSVDNIKRSSFRVKNYMLIMNGIAFIFSFIYFFYFTRGFTLSINKVIEFANAIAQGDLTRRLEFKGAEKNKNDEISMLAKAFDTMAESLEDRANIAKAIAYGDLSKKVVLLSDKDILGKSFIVMIESLNIKANAAEEISNGNLDIDLKVSSTKDRFGRSFQIMINSIKNVVNQASAIAEGDFNKEIIPRSNNDKLGNALQKMTYSLREMTKLREYQDWIKSGQNQLSEQIRGDHDIVSLSKNTITFMAKYLNAQIGCLYVYDDQNDILRLSGSYAFNNRKHLNSSIKIGEGLVGQAAFEKEMISITKLPEDYMRINSAIGDTLPKNVIVVPVLYEDRLKGVLELGSIEEFGDNKIDFFKIVSENIAIAVNSAQSRQKMNELLIETKSQAFELERQQKILEKSNQELEEQTLLLKKSEADLKNQQKELTKANNELKEKTHSLETQKEIINQKNIALENTKKDLQKKAKELELASKYKSDFLANMSHELRTPLNSLLILAQSFKENKYNNLTPQQVEYASIIYKSGKDLLNLINDILDLSKVEAGMMTIHVDKIDLKDIANNIERNFKHIVLNKNLEFKIQLSNDLPRFIKSDRQRIEQIIKNLVSNAIKFTSKGKIEINMFKPKKFDNLSHLNLMPDKIFAISVVDTGIGIPEEKQKEIFNAFYQVDSSASRKFGGTGLGLSISKKMAHLLNGEIQFESERSKGSVFTLYLPLNIDEQDNKQDISIVQVNNKQDINNIQDNTNNQDNKNKTESIIYDYKNEMPDNLVQTNQIKNNNNFNIHDKIILIIEDDPNFAKILKDQCHLKNFKAITASNGKDGLIFAEKHMPEGIILDIFLPDINGFQVLEMLKDDSNLRHIPVHVISAKENIDETSKLGAISYHKKPVTLEQINNALIKIEELNKRQIKKVLIVEKDVNIRKKIYKLIKNNEIEIIERAEGKQALDIISKEIFDCMILEPELPDISGLNMLKQLEKINDIVIPPVIVYTSLDLNNEEIIEFDKYCNSIIFKDKKSEDQLLDETYLFLHTIVKNLPEEKQRIIANRHNKYSILKDKKVLIVDDDMRSLYSLANTLKEKQINVIKADNGKHALNILNKESDFDIVLMDIMMPVMDGYETIKEIRKQKKFINLPIIALTAKAMKEDRDKCIEAGANEYLPKPIEMESLLSLMKKILQV